jgi:quercetin dioxygenase-like cupin family protein
MSLFFPDPGEMTRRTIFPGVNIATCSADKMMLSVVDLDSGSAVGAHSHPHEQVGVVLSGRLHFFIGDEDRVLTAGDVYRIPGGVTHRVVTLEGPARALDVFAPPREDYR